MFLFAITMFLLSYPLSCQKFFHSRFSSVKSCSTWIHQCNKSIVVLLYCRFLELDYISTAKEGKQLFVQSDQSHIRRKSNPLETEITAMSELNTAKTLTKDHSQSAKSSPQKQVRDMKRLRAHSDTSLNKVSYWSPFMSLCKHVPAIFSNFQKM